MSTATQPTDPGAPGALFPADGERIVDLFAGCGGEPGECWTGLGTPSGHGYRTVRRAGRNYYVHRLAYERFHGPIPDGLVVDHLCHDPADCAGGPGCPHRECWNPAHLALATDTANVLRGASPPAVNARKERCPEGHDYATGSNGYRYCPMCRYEARVRSGEILGLGRPETRTHCPQGHAYDEANTYLVRRPDGSVKQRMCRECGRRSVRRRRALARGGDAR